MGLFSFGFCGAYQGRLKFGNRASRTLNFWNCFFRKAGSGLLDAWGLPVLPCFPTPLVSV
jgi:hypothetical protein